MTRTLAVLAALACAGCSFTGDQAEPGGAGAPDASAAATCATRPEPPPAKTWTVYSSGVAREAIVQVPASYDRTRRTPVVLNFHGYTSEPAQQAVLSTMSAKAEEEGFIVVYPRGLDRSWNAGACCGESERKNVDDVRFVEDLLDLLESQLCVDADRVYATGMSNGGFLSHRLACELADRIAAIAPVAGVLGLASCTPTRPVPVMHFHGTADTLVPYDGSSSIGFPPVPATAAAWAARNGCTGAPTESFRRGDTHCITYAGCVAAATVTLCTVEQGGHTWPGGTPIPPFGHTTRDLSATDAMWTFFVAHPR